jgi:hypothetical protein
MVLYKEKAEDSGIPGVCTLKAFRRQVELALFAFHGFEEEYKHEVERGQKEDARQRYATGFLDLRFSVNQWRLEAYRNSDTACEPLNDFFKDGENKADNKYFSGLKGKSLL